MFANGSGPSSLASSRDSSLDRGEAGGGKGAAGVPYGGLHTVVTRAVQSPKMTLRQRFQVMRSGSFNDVEVQVFSAKAQSNGFPIDKTRSAPTTNGKNRVVVEDAIPP